MKLLPSCDNFKNRAEKRMENLKEKEFDFCRGESRYAK
jgi:hypothetical protein